VNFSKSVATRLKNFGGAQDFRFHSGIKQLLKKIVFLTDNGDFPALICFNVVALLGFPGLRPSLQKDALEM
jgi:hypothetical protein